MSELTRGRFILRAALATTLVVLAGAMINGILGDRQRAEAQRAFHAKLGAYLGAGPRVADERNAAVPLVAGAQALIISVKDKSLLGEMTMKPASGWTAGEREYLRSVLDTNRPGLDLLVRSGGMRESDFGLDPLAEHDPDEFKSRMPLLKLLWGQRLLWLDANEAWIANDRARFATATAAMASLASALERESPMIAGLIGVASEKVFHSAAATALTSSACDLETVAGLRNDLPSEDLAGSWRRVIAYESRGLSAQDLARLQGERGDLRWYTRALDGFHELILGGRDQAQRLHALVVLANSLGVPYGSSPDWTGARAAEVRQRYGFSLLPGMRSLFNAAGRYQTALAGRQLIRTALWVREQSLRTGSYPASLAGSPDGTKPDAFSGSPLVYEVHADGSVTLAIKNGDELWHRLEQNIRSSLPFAVRLPPAGR